MTAGSTAYILSKSLRLPSTLPISTGKADDIRHQKKLVMKPLRTKTSRYAFSFFIVHLP
jgi:hypothetical protein